MKKYIIYIIMLIISSYLVSGALTDKLISYYKFNNDVTDELGNFDGAPTSISYTTNAINGSYALLMTSASGQDVVFADMQYQFSDAMTTCFWLNLTNTCGGAICNVLSSLHGGFTYPYMFIGFQISSTSFRTFWEALFSDPSYTNFVVAQSLNVWNHYCVVMNETRHDVYINGAYNTGGDKSIGQAFRDWDSPLRIGDTGSTAGFVGMLDEMGLWNRTLTNTEIALLYNDKTSYPFDEAPPPTTPVVSVVFPTNVSYTKTVSDLNYTVTDGDSCWYSVDAGVTNSSTVPAGTNFTGLTSVEGSNEWIVFCNSSDGTNASDNVLFTIEFTIPSKIVRQYSANNLTFPTGGWLTPNAFNDSWWASASTPTTGDCDDVFKTYYKSSANGTGVNNFILESKFGSATLHENYTFSPVSNHNCFNRDEITFRWWCPSNGNVQFECINVTTGLSTVLKPSTPVTAWAYETLVYWNSTINQSIYVDFLNIAPLNDTVIKNATNVSFNLLAYNKTANCSVHLNNEYYIEYVNATEGSYTFEFNETIWDQQQNEINVTCRNETVYDTEIKYLFIDDIFPQITINTPVNLSEYTSFAINVTTNDSSNYGLNISLVRSGYGTQIFFNQTVNVTKPTYNYYRPFSFGLNATGWYDLNVVSYDAHTKNNVNFNKKLKERNYITGVYLGIEFDEAVKVYFRKADIFRFYTVKNRDRKKFDVKFKNDRTDFDIFIEADDIKYVGDKYGYLGHFVINNEYWIDLNNNGSAVITGVEEVGSNLYKVSMNKPSDVDYVMFYSIGVLNSNSKTIYVYNNNVNTAVDSTVTTYSNGTEVSFVLNPHAYVQTFVKIFRQSQANETFFSFDAGHTGVQNVSLYIGDVDGTPDFTHSGVLDGLTTTSSLHDELETVFLACSCSDCSITGNDECNVPINVVTNSSGTLILRDFYASLILEAGQVNFRIYDANTVLPLTGVNITVQLIGDEFQGETTTTTSNATIFYNFNESIVLNLSARAFQTDSPKDYSIVIRNLELTQGEETNVTFYLSNTSNSVISKYVTFRVVDEFATRIQGATVQVYKQNPATNQFLLITEMTTNPNGEASTLLFIDDVFYKFIVEYEGATVFTSQEVVSISPTDDLIILTAILDTGILDFYDKINYDKIKDYSLTFTNLTSTSGYFRTTTIANSIIETCLYMWLVNSSGNEFIEAKCQNGTSTAITSSVLSPSDRRTYLSWLYIDYKDNEGKIPSKSLIKTLGTSKIPAKQNALLIVFVVATLLSGMVFYFNPQIGVLFYIGMNIILMLANLFPFGSRVGMLIISLCLISLITISRTNTNA